MDNGPLVSDFPIFELSFLEDVPLACLMTPEGILVDSSDKLWLMGDVGDDYYVL